MKLYRLKCKQTGKYLTRRGSSRRKWTNDGGFFLTIGGIKTALKTRALTYELRNKIQYMDESQQKRLLSRFFVIEVYEPTKVGEEGL